MDTGFNLGESSPRQKFHGLLLEHELSELRLLVERKAGVLLDLPLDELVEQLGSYMEFRRLTSFSDLMGRLQGSESECEALLERLLDGETAFYRHPQAFAAFERQALPELYIRKSSQTSRSLRIWSAGCATGEEAYSVALSICDAAYCHGSNNWTIHVLASDIRQQALTFAERGLFSPAALEPLSRAQIQRYFARVGQHYLVKPRLRNLVTFTQMNLARPAHLGRFDCIFCMDLLNHFSMSQRIALTQRLHLYLEPGGYLFLGDAEKLHSVDVKFQTQTDGAYFFFRKPMTAAARAGWSG
jgi:two-component system, chemotaxis family, CheB/CheR fusion protein